MKHFLRKRCREIASFTLSLFLFSNYLSATPECPIVTGRFQNPDGTTSVNSSTGWFIDATHVASTGYFAVKSNRFHAQELGGEGIWYSKVFSTAGYSDFKVAVKVSSEGDMNSSEYVKIYYKINGGALTLLDQRTGNFGTIDFISPVLTGNNVQIIVKIYNYNNGGSQTSKYYIEEYRVFKEHGPCGSSISVTATAGNGGVLTCTNSSITLSASSPASGVTYSWTGPGGFSSTSQNPVISVPGNYNVVGTNSSGSGSASVTVTENKVAPDLTATGGSLSCGSSVTLNANSTVANAQYSWTGPGSFTSAIKNPVVSTAGTYVATVTNPANGCTASQSVQVTGGANAPVTLWNEDFTLPDSTSVDNGSTSWSIQNTSNGMFKVKSNEFKVTNIGTSTEGVWTSGAINISGKSNVTVSVDVRSGVSSGGALENSGSSLDYVRVYYKINNGAEVLFSESLGTINSNSSTNSTVSIGSLSGSTVQVIIRSRATASDEFYYFDNVKVTGVNGASTTISTSVSGIATCTGTAQIFATANNGTISSWSWTGPNGFTSTSQNPVVSAGGVYVVTGTMTGGCTTSAPVTVTENKTAPDIMATGGSLICQPNITLNVNSAVANAQYSWTGPGGFSSNTTNPSVSVAGTYTATVTDPANGCTAAQAVQVTSSGSGAVAFWTEDFSLPNGTTSDAGATAWTIENSGSGTYSVQNNEFKTSFSGASEGRWYSQVIDISAKTNVVLSVDLRSETASTNDFFESDDYIRVYYKLDGGAETLVYEDFAGINSTTTGTASISINSAALNGSTLQVIIKTRNSDPTERYFFDNVKITGAENNNLNVVASAAGFISCNNPSLALLSSATTTVVTYNWSGPDGFTSSEASPVVTSPGIYTLTAINSNGCSGTDTALVVAADTAKPADVTASVGGIITCDEPETTITGSSSTPGVTYQWTGPFGFTSTSPSATVIDGGPYTLTVTNPATGCTSTALVEVVNKCKNESRTPLPQPLGGGTPETAAAGFEYKAWPNPITGNAYIEFTYPQSAVVTISIYNTLGGLEKVLFNNTVVGNQHYKLPVNGSKLQTGTYYFVMRVNGKYYTRVLIK